MRAFHGQGYLGDLNSDLTRRTRHLVVTAGYESEGCRLFAKRAQFRSHASLFILSSSSPCRKVMKFFAWSEKRSANLSSGFLFLVPPRRMLKTSRNGC
jgi:hypothetical protein